jgi:hypothetical protein
MNNPNRASRNHFIRALRCSGVSLVVCALHSRGHNKPTKASASNPALTTL